MGANEIHRGEVGRVRGYLIEDSWWRSEKAAEEIGEFCGTDTGDTNLHGAYADLNCQYRHASARAPNPSQSNMAKITKGYATIY